MNISVERKIASIAEKLEGVTYLFDISDPISEICEPFGSCRRRHIRLDRISVTSGKNSGYRNPIACNAFCKRTDGSSRPAGIEGFGERLFWLKGKKDTYSMKYAFDRRIR